MSPPIHKSTTTTEPPGFIRDKFAEKLIRDYIEDQARTAALEKEMEDTKKRAGRRMAEAMALVALSYFYCLIFENQAEIISKWLSKYIPIIEKLHRGTEIGILPANFFSINILISPILAIRIVWESNSVPALKYAANSYNVNISTYVLFLLLFGIPIYGYIIYSIFQGNPPIQKSNAGRCGNCLYWTTNTHIGLFIIGGLLICQLIICWSAALKLIITPILLLKTRLTKGN
jgi:hypothetical protein